VDAGHGGFDSGAVGAKGTEEKDMNLDMALHVRDLLQAQGATVKLTREDDSFVVLEDRPALANDWGGNLFVSIHCNSTAARNVATGVQTYYTRDMSKRLANTMQSALADGSGLDDGGVHTANFAVTRETTMPAILIEMGFLSSDHDEALLRSADFRERAAEAVVEGLRRYAAGG
jgi:N-acetylmuramoyl-L-alanine amidase